MTVEEGLVNLVQSDPTVAGLTPNGGGFLATLPKDTNPPSWSYIFFGGKRPHGLRGERGLTQGRMQIDCYGNSGTDSVNLAAAIDAVLDSYSGTITDGSGSVIVDSCMLSDTPSDYFDSAKRTYRRMLEYEVWYIPSI